MTDSQQPGRAERWAVNNSQRVRLVGGFLMVAFAAFGAWNHAIVGSVLNGFVGVLAIGGWPALKRL